MYNKPFIISKKKGETFIKYYSGLVNKYYNISEISQDIEQIFIMPFGQAREKGYEISSREDSQIVSIVIQEKKEFYFEEFFSTFSEKDSILEGDYIHNFTQQEYKNIVKNIVEKEIGEGVGSNFLIAQKLEGKIKDFDIEVALSIFKRLLQGDYGTYLHFIFFDGENIYIGASPERNVSVEGTKVRMNPISGTFRKNSYNNYLDFRGDFLDFLKDQKEINELFMATDEELKMMSKICSSGGIMVGPILKEMAHIIHTEYLLSGDTKMNKLDVLKESMWASTVIGSPLESGFRAIKKYENFNRKYYSGAICHLKKDSLDSAIMIRTMQADISGKFDIIVGASLVKDSNPDSEYKELQGKLKGLLTAITTKVGKNKLKESFLNNYYLDHEVQEIAQSRNSNLSKTWFFKQEVYSNKYLKGKTCLIINNEDDFTNMLAHLLKLVGMEFVIKRFDEVSLEDTEIFDFTLIGPGPGNPLKDDSKMLKNLKIIDYLVKNNKKFFGVCLGHQLISRYFGLNVLKKKISTQGEQKSINLFGVKQKVGFYNTFSAFISDDISKEFDYSYNKSSGEIYAIRGDKFFSFQFHPESILTQYGVDVLLKELLLKLQ